MKGNGLLTIKEAATVAKVNISTLYKAIQSGRIQVESIPIRGKTIKKIRRVELERIYCNIPMEANGGESKFPITSNGGESTPMEANGGESIPLEILKTAVKEVIEAERGQLMRPLEEQALYLVGELRNEVKHLQAEKETLRIENQELQEKLKALPDLQKEKEEQDSRHMAEQQNQIRELGEKEQKIKDLEQSLKQAEEKHVEISEAWKNKVEELQKPWYKKLWS
jgi:DNA repair exonuclease SbcCD ATPase subunit